MSRAFFFLVLNILQASLLLRSAAQSHICLNDSSNTSNREYANNLNSLLFSVPDNVGPTGFFQDSVGWNGPDTANVVVICRADVHLDSCRDCIRSVIPFLQASCPDYRQAFGFADFCTLRYSNRRLTQTLETSPQLYQWNTNNITSPGLFMTNLMALLSSLRDQAAAGDVRRKVGFGNVSYVAGQDSNQTVFAMVQCTPDLTSENCSFCLTEIYQNISRCCEGRIGGRVIAPSCNLRFEIAPFYNETRLQEMAAPPLPVALPDEDRNKPTRTAVVVIVSVAGCMVLAAAAAAAWLLIRKRMKLKHESKWFDLLWIYVLLWLEKEVSHYKDVSKY